MELIQKYFPDLGQRQIAALAQLEPLYREWNSKVNVISRKDMDHFYERHVLHSLAIGRFVSFPVGSRVLDVGTGGGFPGIPLAILFPETHFTLVDSIGKKIRVVRSVAGELALDNVIGHHRRAEQLDERFDYIVSRAVTAMPKFVGWTKSLLSEPENSGNRGIWYLKGGDLHQEMSAFEGYKTFDLSDIFDEEFFATKKLVYLPTGCIKSYWKGSE